MFLLLIVSFRLKAQDSLRFPIKNYENPFQIEGNSWYFAGSYNFSANDDILVNIGRTYGEFHCSRHFKIPKTFSWGLGYGTSVQNSSNHMINAFVEGTSILSARLDYFYLYFENQHYTRPSFGISFTHFDILYNYSIKLAGEGKNQFRHGFTLRVKIYRNKKNWDCSFVEVF